MAETIHAITRCDLVQGTDRMRLDLRGETGPYEFEIGGDALNELLRHLLSESPIPGKASSMTNAIMPTGCAPFETQPGLCGLAFKLGDRTMHVVVPPNGIGDVRKALDAIEAVYAAQKKAGP